MQYLKNLLLAYPYFERIPDSTLVVDQGTRYDYIAATKEKDFAFFYTYTGRKFTADLSKINGPSKRCFWYDPTDGKRINIEGLIKTGLNEFTPPKSEREVNDWVLVVENSDIKFSNH